MKQNRTLLRSWLLPITCGIMALSLIACGNGREKCEKACEDEYNLCMQNANSIGDEIQCGNQHQICATNCAIAVKPIPTGPGTTDSQASTAPGAEDEIQERTGDTDQCPCNQE